jgi:hypothetical protein
MKIVYLVQNKFTGRDYFRYGIEELIAHSKMEVEIWDISRILYPNALFDYQDHNIMIDNRCQIRYFRSYNDLSLFTKKTDILYCISLIIFDFKSFKVFKILSDNNILYGGTGLGMINIVPEVNNYLINTNSIFKKLFNVTIRRLLSVFKKLLFLLLIKSYKINFYKVFFLSGGVKAEVDNILVSKKTKKIRLHSNNFDLHLKQSKKFKKMFDYDYDIYLDQNVTNSSDSILRNNKLNIPSHKYYKELNVFLKKLERVSKRKIIVAAHPKANIKELKTYMSNYEIITQSDSSNLIFHSTNVIVGYSMAMGFGILYNKDLILITNNDINKYKKPVINSISNYLNINYINISKKYNLKTDLNFNKSKYSNYVNDFITCDRNDKIFFSIKMFNFFNNSTNKL